MESWRCGNKVHDYVGVMDIPGYDVEVSDYSIYSYETETILMRRP